MRRRSDRVEGYVSPCVDNAALEAEVHARTGYRCWQAGVPTRDAGDGGAESQRPAVSAIVHAQRVRRRDVGVPRVVASSRQECGRSGNGIHGAGD